MIYPKSCSSPGDSMMPCIRTLFKHQVSSVSLSQTRGASKLNVIFLEARMEDLIIDSVADLIKIDGT